ncbi:hypothetical protein DAEQUDRAFT_726701 [Daedalea quercina L-15889]|uniref:Extracellular membrane protein CFEM domain-containing protein n=1 Tax=Daedalea quercina L-15889 TaxID=1314783 RepID=A0A165QFN0_9APHY|nr:hypothetical protein DAEQUDRAFT_726701 [Daedalea quercina L-15889]
MHFSSRRLLVSLVFGWAALHSVEARPSLNVAVELSTCGNEAVESYSIVEECVSTCQPVFDAQNCSRSAACTCAAARPMAVHACVQCQLDARSSGAPSALALIVPSRLHDYAELCGEDITAQAVLRFDDDSTSTTNTTLESRELLSSACIYGVPEIATSPLAILESGKRAWPFFAVAVLMMLYLFERRSHR